MFSRFIHQLLAIPARTPTIEKTFQYTSVSDDPDSVQSIINAYEESVTFTEHEKQLIRNARSLPDSYHTGGADRSTCIYGMIKTAHLTPGIDGRHFYGSTIALLRNIDPGFMSEINLNPIQRTVGMPDKFEPDSKLMKSMQSVSQYWPSRYSMRPDDTNAMSAMAWGITHQISAAFKEHMLGMAITDAFIKSCPALQFTLPRCGSLDVFQHIIMGVHFACIEDYGLYDYIMSKGKGPGLDDPNGKSLVPKFLSKEQADTESTSSRKLILGRKHRSAVYIIGKEALAEYGITDKDEIQVDLVYDILLNDETMGLDGLSDAALEHYKEKFGPEGPYKYLDGDYLKVEQLLHLKPYHIKHENILFKSRKTGWAPLTNKFIKEVEEQAIRFRNERVYARY